MYVYFIQFDISNLLYNLFIINMIAYLHAHIKHFQSVCTGKLATYLYIVSASTSENQTLRSGVKSSPLISSIERSAPPDSLSPLVTGTGVTGADTGPIPS